MTNQEKIIKRLEEVIAEAVYPDRPRKFMMSLELAEDVLALLKAQEPRVMTWEEAQANVNKGPFIIVEVTDSIGTELDFGVLVGDSYEMSDGSLLGVCDFDMMKNDYGIRFRCWTSRPTYEQRKAVKWE